MKATEQLDAWLTKQKPNGLRRQDFATKIGTSPSVLSRILAGEFRPRFDTMVRIRDATNGEVTLNMWAEPVGEG